MSETLSITGLLADISGRSFYPAEITVSLGRITAINRLPDNFQPASYILPGFIDSHVHIESSMLVPSEFARLAVVHGTVATVSDPHEIANVCGIAGVEYMIANGKKAPFKFNFGAPSCVPATVFETAGATLDATAVKKLLALDEIRYLSEMMNFPGVLQKDPEVMEKIKAAKDYGKPIDGHAPGLRGDAARQYIDAGISTDHECFTSDEGLDKLKYGMKVLIREGSAAKNFEALIGLLNDYPDDIMFCSDDKHPDSLVLGHINQLCERAVAKGIDIFHVLKAACINPVLHYKLDVGLLRIGDPADFILVKDLVHFKVQQTYINGMLVAENGKSLISSQQDTGAINHFSCNKKIPAELQIREDDYPQTAGMIPVIGALDGQLITEKLALPSTLSNGLLVSNQSKDILKIVVVNRYRNATVSKAFIHGFGLQHGALASSVAHDSHNIVAIGVDDESICRAINLVIEQQGGISFVNGATEMIVPLPVAGLMSHADGYEVAAQYAAIDKAVKKAGATLASPFMTLSFMALLVIPHLKLSDLGLFDGDNFTLERI